MQSVIKTLMTWLGFAPAAVAQGATVWIYDNSTDLAAVAGDGPSTIIGSEDDETKAVQTSGEVTPEVAASPTRDTRLFAARLSSVGRINRKAAVRKPIAKAAGKRSPDLYPMKRRAPVAKKPVLKVLTIKPKVRPSAMIIPFPAARIRKAKMKLAA
ncbi:MAG: hypothetical protein K2Y05_11080 [Hyphomicrobiaceae bacterium]|nr:hypothetical protein [Hyphomicrobiaceae bacterium]